MDRGSLWWLGLIDMMGRYVTLAAVPHYRNNRSNTCRWSDFGGCKPGIFYPLSTKTKKAPKVFTPGALIYMNPSKNGMVIGSPARTRTTDTVVNSHLLCRLSYWGIFTAQTLFCQSLASVVNPALRDSAD